MISRQALKYLRISLPKNNLSLFRPAQLKFFSEKKEEKKDEHDESKS